MKVANAIAEILKREGVEFIIGYPVNPIIEAAAEADIRTIIVRQERTGLHMADAFSRLNSGGRIGVFAMQHGPGTENAVGGAQNALENHHANQQLFATLCSATVGGMNLDPVEGGEKLSGYEERSRVEGPLQ